jgi:YVTN family beta-propeller protein
MAETGAVLVLDAASLATKQSIAVGAMPAEITFTRDGSKAFVGNSGANSVSVIDVSTKAVVTTIPVGAAPVGAWVGLDDVMYVDNEAGKSLTAIDAKTLAVVRTYELGFTPAMAATAPSGELWVTDTDAGRIVVFAAGTTTKAGEIETGAGAHAIAFSADGQTAYSTSQTSGTVSVIDVATRAVKKTITVGAKPNGIAFRPAL